MKILRALGDAGSCCASEATRIASIHQAIMNLHGIFAPMLVNCLMLVRASILLSTQMSPIRIAYEIIPHEICTKLVALPTASKEYCRVMCTSQWLETKPLNELFIECKLTDRGDLNGTEWKMKSLAYFRKANLHAVNFMQFPSSESKRWATHSTELWTSKR